MLRSDPDRRALIFMDSYRHRLYIESPISRADIILSFPLPSHSYPLTYLISSACIRSRARSCLSQPVPHPFRVISEGRRTGRPYTNSYYHGRG